ncbi:MAG: hypothetical protein COY86_05905, partial [Rhodobacterales bacterium CG_4_10_14_0_8_um_filter_70_9]
AAKARRDRYPAPWAILELWQKYGGDPFAPGREDPSSIAFLAAHSSTRNLIRLFGLQERLKALGRQSDFAPRRVHVVGAGTMGGDIAAWCALNGLRVTLQDRDAERIAPAIGRAGELFRKRLHDRLRARDAMDRLVPDLTGEGARQADVIIEAIFENTDAVVFIKRRNGELLAANRRYHELAGRADVVGRTDHELYGRETGDALRARDLALFRTGAPFTGEERVTLPDGREVVYLSSKFLIHDPALNDMVLCGIATDISAQKRLQASLEASTRAAEQAALAKAQFLAAMSHEIRTPMNGVLGMLALLATTPLDDRQRAMATTARDSAFNLMKMLNDILDYACIDTHELTFSHAPFDLRETLEAAAEQARPAAKGKGLTLAVAVAQDAPHSVSGDALRVRQVLGALLDNAVKFTDRGGVRLEAGVCGDALRVVVRDTGVGVPRAAGDIFAGFTQGDGSSTRRHGGVGLGLTLGKRLVEAMGGAIGFDSVEGAGAAFWFTLPLNQGAQSA